MCNVKTCSSGYYSRPSFATRERLPAVKVAMDRRRRRVSATGAVPRAILLMSAAANDSEQAGMANGFLRVWNPWQLEMFPTASHVIATGPQDDAGASGWRCPSLVLKVARPFRRCRGSFAPVGFEPIPVPLFANQNLTHRLGAIGAAVLLIWRSRVWGEQFVAPRSMAVRFFFVAWLAIAHAGFRDRRFGRDLGRHGDRFDRTWLGCDWQVHGRQDRGRFDRGWHDRSRRG